jgi:hypothetical protein
MPVSELFESVDLSNAENASYWRRTWNVTEIQLRIAVLRVGSLPARVLRELLGGF